MYHRSNQIKSPDDEEEDQPETLEDGDNSKIKDSATKESGQETFHSYYNQNFGPMQDFRVESPNAHNEKWPDFVCSAAVSASNHTKISSGRLMQESFDSASPKFKAKKGKAEIIEFHGGGGGGGGGRVVRSTSRKDRHSKVRTARGPRDRRVRLSPRTAIQFYDVQDRLGYDRPSKAIDWLIKEAKTAIDALDEQPGAAEKQSPPISNHGGFLVSDCGMSEKHEHLTDENPVSGFGFSVDAAALSSSTEFRDGILNPSDQQGFCSALTATSEILETNWEMVRLQKMLTWNCGNANPGNARGGGGAAEYSSGNSPPLHSAVQPISGHSHMFSQREPLQSSIMNYSPIYVDFPEFNFCNELSNITASATLKEDERDKKLVFSRASSTAPFLHYED